MARMPLQCRYCSIVACVVWLALHAAALHAQPRTDATSADNWDFQYDLFLVLLERQGLAPVAQLGSAMDRPEESVIVIAGDPSQLPARSLRELSRFVQRGGALLLATDHPWLVPGIAQFANEHVKSDDPETRYQGYSDCVKVTAIASADPRLSGVSTIVTNRSTWLQFDSNGPFTWDVGAIFPESCSPAASRGQPLLAMRRTGQDDSGRIVLSADASLFTNGMLWHGDNAILAIRVSGYLAGSGRTRLAFWADGRMLASVSNQIASQASADRGDVEVQHPVPEPDLQKVLKLANAVASEVAQSNVLNETLKQRPRHWRPSEYFRRLLILLTAVSFLAVAWIVATNGSLRPFSAVGRKSSRRNAARTRAHALPELADYRAPAGYLAREFCWELTGSRHSTDWQKYLARQLVFEPRLSPLDQQDLARIVDIASRGCRERMNATDFEQLGKTIAVLRAKHKAANDSADSTRLNEPAGNSAGEQTR